MSVETLEIEDNVSPKLAHIATGGTHAAQSLADLQKMLDRIMPGSGLEKLRTELLGVDAELEKLRANASRGVDVDVRMHKSGGGGSGGLDGMFGAAGAGAFIAQQAGQNKFVNDMVTGVSIVTLSLHGLLTILDSIYGVSKKIASLTLFDGTALAVEMSNAKSEAERVFERFTGSKAAADEMYESVKNLANITGESPEAVAGRMKKLLAEGFKPLLAGNIMQAMADEQAALGDSEASKLEGIFEKLHNRGALDQKMFKSLTNAGIDSQRIYASLASHLHESIAQVKADLKAGTIAGDEAAAAIAEAVEGKFGGSAQERANNDIFVMLARVKNDARALFEDIDISPIKDATKSLFEALEGPGGKELAGGLQDMFGSIFHSLFDPFKGPEGVQKLTNVMHAIAEGAHGVGTVARAVAPVVSWLVEKISELSRVGDGASGSSGFAKLVAGMKLFADSILLMTGLISGQTLADDIAKLFDVDQIEIPDVSNIGTRMIDGLENGITGGASRVVDALVSACTSAVKAAEGVLGIHSPSTVFAHIGDMTAEGFANGVAANDSPSLASSAMASGAARAATVSGAPGAASGGGGARGDVHVTINSPIAVHANDAQGGADAAEAAAPGINGAHREAATSYWRDWKEAG